MKTISKYAAALAAVGLSFGAAAQTVTGAVDVISTNTPPGWLSFTLVGSTTCTTGAEPGIWYQTTNADYNAVRADLLLSKMTGTPVTVTIDSSAGWCRLVRAPQIKFQ